MRKTAVGALLALAFSAHTGIAVAWDPPIGVPRPDFGIDEVAGPATHFVDNSVLCSDSSPTGTPAAPRCSIPLTVPPGSVVEVRGGPYSPGSTTYTVDAQGSAGRPIFYKGVGNPRPRILNRTMNLVGSYVVIEGFDLNNANADRQRAQISLRGGSHHVAIRNNEIHEQIPDPGGCAICVGGAQDVVIYSNHIHHNAWDPRSSVEHDIHGVQVPAGSQRVWIVDNEFDHNGGDAVQVNSGRNILASHIYIARNNMHEDTENCIDIKQAEDVIISQNTCWGYVPTAFGTSGSDGTAIVINDDNIANGLNNRVWVIFNQVHSSVNGIRTQAYAYVIGNVLHDLAGAGLVSFGSHDVWFEHNTIYNAQGGGIDRSGGATTFKVEARNNIFHPGAGRDAVSLTSNASGNSVLHNSLFTAPIRWSGVLYGSLASFQSAVPGRCSGCRAGDPLFVNPAASDFRLQAGSPAIDGAAPSSLYDLFESLYGLNIRVDVDGTPRPQGAAWDMGAHEFTGETPPRRGGAAMPPPAPTGLTVR